MYELLKCLYRQPKKSPKNGPKRFLEEDKCMNCLNAYTTGMV